MHGKKIGCRRFPLSHDIGLNEPASSKMKTFPMNRLLHSRSCKNVRLIDVLPSLLSPSLIKHLFVGIAESKAL